MSNLLNKRLARSLWRTKPRLFAVVMMVAVGVFAGITFSGYSHNLDGMYETLHGDDDEGANLADMWIDNRSTTWSHEEVMNFCSALEASWPADMDELDSCEGRTIVQGTMFHSNDGGTQIINSLWHGIPEFANADRVWMPSGHSEGRVASAADEIVIDAHVVDALDLSLGDTVHIGAGSSPVEFSIVGIGYHPLHVFMAPEGSIFPPEPGQYVVGYVSDSGMARLTNSTIGNSNTILLDVEGTPSFDLPDTEEYEGDEIDSVRNLVSRALENAELDGRIRDRGQNEPVEIMRQDLEGAKRTSVPFAVMIAAIASITIVLSLQRLVQSQAKEIAALRTLGVNRMSLMTGYLIAPLAIGAAGCGLGAVIGPLGVDFMLDFYEGNVGLPITERELPVSNYSNVMIPTIAVVFLSGAFPALKASKLDPLEVLSGQNQIRVGSRTLRRLTSWMPTTLGLSIRSSIRKPVRLMMTFLAVGISLMLFGSVQMMSAGLEDTIVGGLEDRQSWDAQVYINHDQEQRVIEWADQRGATYEPLIEMPIGMVEDPKGLERIFTVVGLESFTEGLREINIIQGDPPQLSTSATEVLLDEGAATFLGWSVGQSHTVLLNGAEHEVTIVGVTRGELARTMYFLRADLGDALGVNATSIYLTLPDGVEVDSSLAEISAGVVERETLIEGMNSLIDQ
ncbi:MAG: FtsX-like permease family protein, partial [Candidatus Thermoplasmatota archaeon]|nr:FtsX-like permease family protein [Candidatus Thermoplasmatota archaeon]